MENKNNVMLDLETFGRVSNSVIASIGACKFTAEDGITDKFYCTVDPRDCAKYGLQTTPSTLSWWKGQDPSTLAALFQNQLPLKDALTKFSLWYGHLSLPTWGNGVAFDNVILANAYEAVGMKRPFAHWEDRCYRTIKNLFPIPADEREGTYHNALDDAIFQAKHLIKIFKS